MIVSVVIYLMVNVSDVIYLMAILIVPFVADFKNIKEKTSRFQKHNEMKIELHRILFDSGYALSNFAITCNACVISRPSLHSIHSDQL